MDVESLQKSGPRRSSCLNVFLVASVIFLFVAVSAVAAGVVMVVVMNQGPKEQHPNFDFETIKRTGDALYPDSKMQKFAYLRAKSSELKNGPMQWTPVHYGPSVSVGSNFQFEQHSLKPQQVGIYFMYIELNFTCTFICEPALLSVRVGEELTCNVQLPAVTDHTPVTRKCWTVSQLNGQSLHTEMTVPQGGLQTWKLELKGSGFGMFLMD
ncbi:uncharacterized protein LOC117759762 [Hippoglossus hippoglossus]|uniref:uncharacterized protein LOC117759762 n=1 Tax=Hippoglossus hippoglossus TaxID=8267 RepID=UPI00148BC786|nr:uncharacterized protein LOC117759762 [Hippoglossus hippoglossus]